MFSTLDSIDWQGLGTHTYSRHEEIPPAIRNLLSPDEALRRGALGFLLGDGQDFGDIYDTTPHIIPFCLEVLGMDGAPGKADLMQHLSGQGRYIAEAGARSVHMMDLCVRTYAALRAGLDLVLSLLAGGDLEERLAACELLQYMTDDPEQILPVLFERVDLETDEDVQANLLHSLKNLLAALEWTRVPLKKRFAPDVRRLVEAHPSRRVRVAAARASVELVSSIRLRGDDLLSPQVGALIAQEFLHPGPPMHWMEDHPSIYQENLVRDLARLSDPAPLLGLLEDASLTAEQAHLLARGLLCQAVIPPRQQDGHWQQMVNRDRRKEGDFYLHGQALPDWKLKQARVRSALRVIAAADRVWERPTNLFSFFYGLPDSRQVLQALVES